MIAPSVGRRSTCSVTSVIQSYLLLLLAFFELLSPSTSTTTSSTISASHTTITKATPSAACIEDPITENPGLKKWEQELLCDCKVSGSGGSSLSSSRLGNIRPVLFLLPSGETSSREELSRAHAILGFKALHNFFYDLCKYEFELAIFTNPQLIPAYWGRALCDAQLIWNSENISSSVSYLRSAPSVNPDDDRNTLYFAAVKALNGGDNPPRSRDEIIQTRPARYKAYLKHLTLLSSKYKDDKTARAFVALTTLAVGSVGHCAVQPADESCAAGLTEARSLLRQAYTEDPTFPGTLHYGMHAHDFPNKQIVQDGLVYARDYPRYVTSATHSLHMPSHLYDRHGDFRAGELSNRASVWAGDLFARSGALQDISAVAGAKAAAPFSFNAGNVYHSLEYQHYELLQMCALDAASSRVSRMIRVVEQSHEFSSPSSSWSENPYFLATSYSQWEMKMLARQIMWGIAISILHVTIDEEEKDVKVLNHGKNQNLFRDQWYFAISAPTLPRLSWKGTTVYSHEFYSPQSEAGYYASLAIALLYNVLSSISSSNVHTYHYHQNTGKEVCGSFTPDIAENEDMNFDNSSAAGCVSGRVSYALMIIDEAELHYSSREIHYEANFVKQLGLQVRAFQQLALGDAAGGIHLISEATRLEKDAVDIALPSSTSIFFLPSSAWEGVLRLMVLSWDMRNGASETNEKDEMDAARIAFSQCLDSAGHPNTPICLVGRGRTSTSKEEAATHYHKVMKQWGMSENGYLSFPKCQCIQLAEEARAALGWSTLTSSSTGLFDLGLTTDQFWVFFFWCTICLLIGIVVGTLVTRSKYFYSEVQKNNKRRMKRTNEENNEEVRVGELVRLNSTIDGISSDSHIDDNC